MKMRCSHNFSASFLCFVRWNTCFQHHRNDSRAVTWISVIIMTNLALVPIERGNYDTRNSTNFILVCCETIIFGVWCPNISSTSTIGANDFNPSQRKSRAEHAISVWLIHSNTSPHNEHLIFHQNNNVPAMLIKLFLKCRARCEVTLFFVIL